VTTETQQPDELAESDELVPGPRGLGVWQVVGLVLAVAIVAVLATVVVQQRTGTPSEDSVDVGFLQDMIAHHGQAVQLGAVGAETATDPSTRHFAQEALIAQQYEVGYMTALLEDWGLGTGDPDRDAMAWMGTPTAVEDMAGMLPAETVEAYSQVTGDEANGEFLRLMSEHHRGGLHMAEYAMEHGSDERVRALATRVARNQRAELAEYRMVADRLGISL
jgi:uncharacterized protein (DUF305 family)